MWCKPFYLILSPCTSAGNQSEATLRGHMHNDEKAISMHIYIKMYILVCIYKYLQVFKWAAMTLYRKNNVVQPSTQQQQKQNKASEWQKTWLTHDVGSRNGKGQRWGWGCTLQHWKHGSALVYSTSETQVYPYIPFNNNEKKGERKKKKKKQTNKTTRRGKAHSSIRYKHRLLKFNQLII